MPSPEFHVGPTTARDPRVPDLLEVIARHEDTHDTVTIELDVSRRPGGFAFAPGQFNMLYAVGVGEVPISISGDPRQPERLVHTIRAVGPVTRALAALEPGDVVGVRGPYGEGWPLGGLDGVDVLIAAGGLGLAPLRPAIEHLLTAPERRRLLLLVGARTPEDMLYEEDIPRWALGRDVELLRIVDRAAPRWSERVGIVTDLFHHLVVDAVRTRALVCGPEVMMRFAARALVTRGLPASAVHLSLERNMKCGVGLCGHCQLGPVFACKDGPVLSFERAERLLSVREL